MRFGLIHHRNLNQSGTTESNFTPAELQDVQQERSHSQKLAERYRCPFVDLNSVRIDPELFRVIPADLMFRFNFVPLQSHDRSPETLTQAHSDAAEKSLDGLDAFAARTAGVAPVFSRVV